MERKKLWLALSALSVAAGQSVSDEKPERAGAATTLQPDVEASFASGASRVLVVGSDVHRDEVIRTDEKGIAHLMFIDKSSLTVGPNSEVTLDRFVYDPKTGAGELALSATRGVLRFVGGDLSKDGDVEIKTPLGTLGIRGGSAYFSLDGTRLLACLFYGDRLTGTSVTNESRTIDDLESCLQMTADGIEEMQLTPDLITGFLGGFSGPPVEVEQEIANITNSTPIVVPTADFPALLREVNEQASIDTITTQDDAGGASVTNLSQDTSG